MEKGFFHAARGYWQTLGEPPAHILAAYPEGTVEVPLKPGAGYEWDGTAWQEVAPDPVEALAAERASMRVTPLQGKLALGEARWAKIEALLDDPATPWALRMAITAATEWHRNSRTVDELGWLLQLTDEDKDRLFRVAATIEV